MLQIKFKYTRGNSLHAMISIAEKNEQCKYPANIKKITDLIGGEIGSQLRYDNNLIDIIYILNL
jgi:hypothetical protein